MNLEDILASKLREYVRSKNGEVDDDTVQEYLAIEVLSAPEYADLDVKDRINLANRAFYRVRCDLSVLKPLVDDPDVSEIMVNGTDPVFIEKNGRLEQTEICFEKREELEDVIRRIAARVHREINELSPILDARLEDGSRVNAVYRNIAIGGPILTIRRFPESRITMKDLLCYETITEEAAEFLKTLVCAAYNIFISGGTSSGKTTFLNVLSNFIPKTERVVTIEDSAELQIREIENIVRLECRHGGAQERGQITMTDLIRASLRMRPDRIIVGEVRGGEVVDMIQAMNTGHDGSLSTGHGNSPQGMLYRLEAMFLQAADFPLDAVRRQITEGIDVIVHLAKLADGRRIVTDIAEIVGLNAGEIGINKLFEYVDGAGLTRTKNAMAHTEKLAAAGLLS